METKQQRWNAEKQCYEDDYPADQPAAVGDQLTHPVVGGTFAQALRAVRAGRTVAVSINNRPYVKLGPVELDSVEWVLLDDSGNVVPWAPEPEAETADQYA